MAISSEEKDLQTIDSANKQLQDVVRLYVTQQSKENNLTISGSADNKNINAFFKGQIEAIKTSIAKKTLGLFEDGLSIDEMQSRTTDLIKDVERKVDLEMGVVRIVSQNPEIAFVGNDPEDKAHVTIRDARLQSRYKDAKSKPDEVPDTAVVIAAGQLRGVLQIIKDSDDGGKKEAAAREVLEVFNQYKFRIEKTKNMEERIAFVEMMSSEMADVLISKEHSLKVGGKDISKNKELKKGIGQVRDLANMTDNQHTSLVTVTDIGRNNIHVSGTVPVKPLSADLEKHYEAEAMEGWNKKINPYLKHSLKGPFVEKIKGGHHMVSSQLPIPGLRNAASENSFVMDSKGENLRTNKKMLRSGTPAHNNGEGEEEPRSTISQQNLEHMVALSEGKQVDITVLNSEYKEAFFGESVVVKGVSDAVARYEKMIAASDKAISPLKYSQKAISVHRSKAKHLKDIVDAFEAKGEQEVQWITCKSGKDRTQAAITQNVLKSFESTEGVDAELSQQRVVRAGHGNAVAANVGATTGINGTKISNVYAGLTGDSVLRQYESQLKTKVSKMNHVEFKDPEKEAILPLIRDKASRISSVKEREAYLSAAQIAGDIYAGKVSGDPPAKKPRKDLSKLSNRVSRSQSGAPIGGSG